ncbi:putative cobalt transporter CbtA [Kribbella voronezhensis]|uniref:Putative cobalt transporter CbtA n=1 Tax=Kribbella voronezhensis TaxID=2512212 RepID=A0A4R7TF56_9ACTN|nr:CbtA family protein [Kribbella voronezhensis]TDU90058.1 putative cobalt transporter CbtA [Kribbella voronezhensis]
MRTFGSLLVRGLIVGLLAGLLAGTFAFVTGEPRIDSAIAIEEANASAHSHDAGSGHHEHAAEEEPLVSRDGQRFGLFLAASLYGVALGGIFAVGFTLLRRRLRTSSDSYAALGLAAAGYVGIVLVPFFKYPPNPPAVGDPDTITQRTVTYLLTLVIGLLAVWAGVAASRWVQRFGDLPWIRLAGGGAALVLTVVVAYLILPKINEVPGTFPATLLWQFRLASLGTQTVLWTLLGIGYAAAIDRRTPVAASSKVVAA